MIAAGLCLMGGCFAQNEDSSVADAYWFAEKVSIPRMSASVGIYEYPDVPSGVNLASCCVHTVQFLQSGIGSYFFVFQGGIPKYNCYSTDVSAEISADNSILSAQKIIKAPYMVEIFADSDGCKWPSLNLTSPPCSWDAGIPGARLRILDARNGEKEFYVSHGQWGYKWYLLPMRSVFNTVAVFDCEEKVLVEL